jgi:hypothetical protein
MADNLSDDGVWEEGAGLSPASILDEHSPVEEPHASLGETVDEWER